MHVYVPAREKGICVAARAQAKAWHRRLMLSYRASAARGKLESTPNSAHFDENCGAAP